MAYYSAAQQYLPSMRSGAKVLNDLMEQMEKDRETDERFAERLFYYETPGDPYNRLKRTAMSPPPTMEQLTQWRLDWHTYQALRTKSRQNTIALSNQLEGLVNGVKKLVGEDVDPKRVAPRRRLSKGGRRTTRKPSVAPPITSDDEEEPSEDSTVFRSLRSRQLLRFLQALRPVNPTYYNFAMATIQEHDVDLMLVFTISRARNPIEGEEQWPSYWKRSPEVCWFIQHDVAEWIDEIREDLKIHLIERGIEMSEREGNVIRDLAEDAATNILIDSGDRLDRFRGPRF